MARSTSRADNRNCIFLDIVKTVFAVILLLLWRAGTFAQPQCVGHIQKIYFNCRLQRLMLTLSERGSAIKRGSDARNTDARDFDSRCGTAGHWVICGSCVQRSWDLRNHWSIKAVAHPITSEEQHTSEKFLSLDFLSNGAIIWSFLMFAFHR